MLCLGLYRHRARIDNKAAYIGTWEKVHQAPTQDVLCIRLANLCSLGPQIPRLMSK